MNAFGPPEFHHPWWVSLGGLVPLLLLVAIMALGVWPVLALTRQRPAVAATGWAPATPVWAPPARQLDSAVEHVRLRYARGEVDREEYLRLLQDLSGPGAPPEAGTAPPSPPG